MAKIHRRRPPRHPRRTTFATQHQSGKVGLDEILCGVLHLSDNTACTMLRNLGIDPAAVASAIEKRLGSESPDDEPILTPSAKCSLELAADEARRHKHTEINPGHLLIALLRIGPTFGPKGLFSLSQRERNQAFEVLTAFDATLPRLREALIRLMQGIEGPLPTAPDGPSITSLEG